jgi:hypothetical protein
VALHRLSGQSPILGARAAGIISSRMAHPPPTPRHLGWDGLRSPSGPSTFVGCRGACAGIPDYVFGKCSDAISQVFRVEDPMTDNNTRNGNLVFLGIVVATAAVLVLQYLGKTTIRDDYDLPPLASPRR